MSHILGVRLGSDLTLPIAYLLTSSSTTISRELSSPPQLSSAGTHAIEKTRQGKEFFRSWDIWDIWRHQKCAQGALQTLSAEILDNQRTATAGVY